jgi:hypothetical protein
MLYSLSTFLLGCCTPLVMAQARLRVFGLYMRTRAWTDFFGFADRYIEHTSSSTQHPNLSLYVPVVAGLFAKHCMVATPHPRPCDYPRSVTLLSIEQVFAQYLLTHIGRDGGWEP